MTNHTETNEDNRVERILKGAGKRSPLPDDVRARLESSFRSELKDQQQSEKRTQRRWGIGIAMAASVIVAVGMIGTLNEPMTREPVAQVTIVGEGVAWTTNDLSGTLIKGSIIVAGDSISTGINPLSLTPNSSSVDVRIAAQSEVAFGEAGQLNLLQGAIYVDSNPADDHFPLVISANGLSVEHIGTQYLVVYEQEKIRVAVREGEVIIASGNGQLSSTAGEYGELLTFQSGELVSTDEIPRHGALFSWANESAPLLDTDNMPLPEFLDWVSRQTGYVVSYHEISLQELDSERLKGSIETTDVFSALKLAMLISGLEASVNKDNGTIIVRPG